MTLGELLALARHRLTDAGIDTAHLDARLLASAALGLSREELLMKAGDEVPQTGVSGCQRLLERRLAGEPVSRILGKREFWGMDFIVTPATLDPRADSELLVELIIGQAGEGFSGRILDLGTGTGCLPIALLCALPKARATAVDVSPAALDCARQNAGVHGVLDRLELLEGSWLEPVTGPYDIVLSNPPYIATPVIEGLMTEVRLHDPRLALDGGADGLDAYRTIIDGLGSILPSRGQVFLEVGYDQSEAVTGLLRERGFLSIAAHNDLAGQRRCVSAVYS
ncbi:MAG: peptide chain release factor N(5)-glutamine methyltransferase [Rhodospirillales bacterium]